MRLPDVVFNPVLNTRYSDVELRSTFGTTQLCKHTRIVEFWQRIGNLWGGTLGVRSVAPLLKCKQCTGVCNFS